MTEPGDGRQAGRGPVAATLRLFALQLAAVVGIAAAITFVVVLVGPDDADVRAGLPSTTSPQETTQAPATSPTPEAKPSDKQSGKQSGEPSGESSGQASDPPAAEKSRSRDSRRQARPRVDVLNQSAGGNAASTTADLLRKAGWRIGRVDDFRGTVRTTTVYYLDADLKSDARALARDLPGQVRVLEGFSSLSETRLSVILVD